MRPCGRAGLPVAGFQVNELNLVMRLDHKIDMAGYPVRFDFQLAVQNLGAAKKFLHALGNRFRLPFQILDRLRVAIPSNDLWHLQLLTRYLRMRHRPAQSSAMDGPALGFGEMLPRPVSRTLQICRDARPPDIAAHDKKSKVLSCAITHTSRLAQ